MKRTKSIRVSYADTVYGAEEKRAVQKVLGNPKHIVAGPAVREFERRIAAHFGKKFGIMVNSGSSANLIALEILGIPPGSEVITPALTFSTTIAPLLQRGLKPVFADVQFGTYVIDCDQVEKLITPNTKALMIPSLIGNIPDFKRLQGVAEKHRLTLIEDSCDTLGATFAGKPTGTYSDASTTSFYASHIITAAGGGGMVMFHDQTLARRALVMAYWGRESTLFGSYEESEELTKRFAGTLNGEPYDAKFIFSEVGYNFQPMELQGAFGLEQLKKLPTFAARRRKNFKALRAFFAQYEDTFILPEQMKEVETSWLAFPLTIREGAKFTRLELTRHLEESGIQTRPIFTGNILRQPAFEPILAKFKAGGFPAADAIMRRGFLIGAHHGMGREHLSHVKEVFKKFLRR